MNIIWISKMFVHFLIMFIFNEHKYTNEQGGNEKYSAISHASLDKSIQRS